jgi:hypothetical protein
MGVAHFVCPYGIRAVWSNRNELPKRTSHFVLYLKQGFGIRLAHGGILACLYRRDGLLPTESFWNVFTRDAELSVAHTMRCLPRICNTALMLRHEPFYTTFEPDVAYYCDICLPVYTASHRRRLDSRHGNTVNLEWYVRI